MPGRVFVEYASLSEMSSQLYFPQRNDNRIASDGQYPALNFLEYFFPINFSIFMPITGIRQK